ncbi:hypothetical protein [Archangium primigenium]|uniref:hypothetical protein n=1 Tax=[Archangium] primigenium TaxID=2792470 RepID=UPI00195E3A65|nr:hypothetical protein [Archangium primigenium]MBM7117632.1 hypothetical protein [Archangium primigenium]
MTFDSGGFVYRDQLEQGKLNGKPVFITEAFGDNHLVFGLANQIYFGMDLKGGKNILLELSQPRFAEDVTTIKAITYIDWKLRHDTALAYSNNVTLN